MSVPTFKILQLSLLILLSLRQKALWSSSVPILYIDLNFETSENKPKICLSSWQRAWYIDKCSCSDASDLNFAAMVVRMGTWPVLHPFWGNVIHALPLHYPAKTMPSFLTNKGCDVPYSYLPCNLFFFFFLLPRTITSACKLNVSGRSLTTQIQVCLTSLLLCHLLYKWHKQCCFCSCIGFCTPKWQCTNVSFL